MNALLTLEALLDDLAKLHVSLNHGDDDALRKIVQKHGYSFVHVGNLKYEAVPIAEDPNYGEDDED